MMGLVGAARWSEWGSEQVTSNYLIANSPRAQVLPLAGYDTFQPPGYDPASKLLHFMGTYRFQGGVFAELARSVLAELPPT